MQKDLLVLSDREISSKHGTNLTYRLVLPAQLNSMLSLLMGYELRIWWAEKTLRKIYLKACFDNCRLYIRNSKASEKQFIVVGQINNSFYIYRDKPISPLEDILDVDIDIRYWQAVELDYRKASYLAVHSLEVSPIVLSLQDAARVNKRKLLSYWPRIGVRMIYPMQLWKAFKSIAALSELVRVNGLDPYETSVVAALIENGAIISVKEILQKLYSQRSVTSLYQFYRDSTRLQAPAFIPVVSISREISLDKSVRNYGKIWVNGLSVEHEEIVATLAHKLESMGLKPYLSPLVDLSLINGNRSALFFEIKTVNNVNLLDRVRTAIGQLLEYRFIYRETFDWISLALVSPLVGSPSDVAFARDFLNDCDIGWVVWKPSSSKFEFLEEIVKNFYPDVGKLMAAN